jgi:protein TonB
MATGGRPWRWLYLIALSALAHGGVAAAFFDETPRASIGVAVISAELVLGSNSNAGAAQHPSKDEIDSAPAAEKKAADTAPEQPEMAREAQQTPPAPQPVAAATQTQSEEQPDLAAASPAVVAEGEIPVEAKVADAPATLAPAPSPEPKVQPAPPAQRSEKPHPAPKQKTARKNHAARTSFAAAPSQASNGIGRGHSDADANYAGRVFAHLARFKDMPAEARLHGDHGRPTVTFGLDGQGRVTRVSLAHSSGVPSLDRAAQAMVRRASPFPAPPAGEPRAFTVPITFDVR